MEANIMELAKQFPQVSITVQAADLLALGSSIVSDTMARYRAEIEAREMLGVCDRTLYRWRRAGYIEGVRVGGAIKYRRSDCRAILAKGKPE